MAEQCDLITSLSDRSNVKSISSNALAYRLAKKPDGTLVLQGAFQWWSEERAGIEWGDIPTVEVD